jgi:hypothetical protein
MIFHYGDKQNYNKTAMRLIIQHTMQAYLYISKVSQAPHKKRSNQGAVLLQFLQNVSIRATNKLKK